MKNLHLKWTIIALVSCIVLNCIELIHYGNQVYLEANSQRSVLVTILGQFFILHVLGFICGVLKNRSAKLTIGKISKYGLVCFILLYAIIKISVICIIHA